MLCPYCGTDCPENARFCLNCGAALVRPAPQPEPEPARSEGFAAPKRFGSHRVPILIMAVLCVIGLSLFYALPGSQPAPEDPATGTTLPESETPWFTMDNGTLYFHEEYYDGPGKLTIPETVNGQTVTTLGRNCFLHADTITTVILPGTLERIEYCAFSGCRNLRGIFLPEGITEIGSDVFVDCTALEAICIPSTVENIGSRAFKGCYALKYILYSGTHEEWVSLYQDLISPKTQVYCTDGTFPHHQDLP